MCHYFLPASELYPAGYGQLVRGFDTAAGWNIFMTDVVESLSDDVNASSLQCSGLGTLSHSDTNATVLGAANHLLIESWIFGCCDRRVPICKRFHSSQLAWGCRYPSQSLIELPVCPTSWEAEDASDKLWTNFLQAPSPSSSPLQGWPASSSFPSCGCLL
ncbi:hypothetical protein LEMLEM_LOCUS25227 [Lemmus lemmus]